MEVPIVFSNSYPQHLVASFLGTLENLVSQKNAKVEKLFIDINTTIKFKLGSILQKLTQSHNRRKQVILDDQNSEDCVSTQFLQIQEKQLVYLLGHLERYYNGLPVFGFNSARFDHHNLITSFMLPLLVNERTLKQLLWRRQSLSPLSRSVIFNYGYKFFLVQQQVLIQPWKHTRVQKQKSSSPRTVWWSWRNVEYRNSPIWRLLH